MSVVVVSLFALFWGANTLAQDGRVPGITLEDCASSKTKETAKKRVLKEDIGGVWKGRKARERLPRQIEITCSALAEEAKTKGPLDPEEEMNLLERLRAELFTNYGPCESGDGKRALSDRYGFSIRTITRACEDMRQKAISSMGSDEILLGTQLDQILDDEGVGRNPNMKRLRRDFMRAHKPGIDADVESPYELLSHFGDPWLCLANRPTASGDDNSLIQLSFSNMGGRFRDSDKYLYDMGNGLELTGLKNGGETLRHLRVLHSEETRVLLIEESVRQDSPLAANAPPAKNDYFESGTCDGEQSSATCEVAINYYECWEDMEMVFTNLYGVRFWERMTREALEKHQNLIQ